MKSFKNKTAAELADKMMHHVTIPNPPNGVL
jgi:hypothetical protein